MWGLVLFAAVMGSPESVFTVAVDPGHGGTNLGAAGVTAGLYEKRVTLQIALKLRRKLAKHKGLSVRLCRERDEMVPIRARVRCANEARADLFISLHTNASPHGPMRGTQMGFEQYVLPVDHADREAALAAAQAQDASDAAWHAQKVHLLVEASLDAAKRLELELSDGLGAERNRGVKQQGAALDVLAGLQMPGILLEVGFLDHPVEGLELSADEGQERIAEALAKGLVDLAARSRRALTDPAITGGRADRSGARSTRR